MEDFYQFLNPELKLDILKTIYQELHSNRRIASSFENKVAFSFCTIFLLLAGFILKGDINIPENMIIIGVISIAYVACLGLYFIINNGNLIRVICSMIVRLEQTLGLYEEEIYISKEKVIKSNGFPFSRASLFPEEVKTWGQSTRWHSSSPHALSIIFSGLVAIAALLIT